MIYIYQHYISPLYHSLGRAIFGSSFGCKYFPTCSEYTRISIQKYGLAKGSWLGLKRFLSCW